MRTCSIEHTQSKDVDEEPGYNLDLYTSVFINLRYMLVPSIFFYTNTVKMLFYGLLVNNRPIGSFSRLTNVTSIFGRYIYIWF